MPYADDFDSYALYTEAPYFADQAGSWEIAAAVDISHGMVMRQVVRPSSCPSPTPLLVLVVAVCECCDCFGPLPCRLGLVLWTAHFVPCFGHTSQLRG